MTNSSAFDSTVIDALMNSCTDASPTAPRQLLGRGNNPNLLNTYIYDYFLRFGMIDCARAILDSDPKLKLQEDNVQEDLPQNRNADILNDHAVDGRFGHTRLDHLPIPKIASLSPDTCFLYEWFCIFWDMFNLRNDTGDNAEEYQHRWNSPMQRHCSLPSKGLTILLQPPKYATLDSSDHPCEIGAPDMTNPSVHMESESGRALQEYQMRLLSMERRHKQELQMAQQAPNFVSGFADIDMNGANIKTAVAQTDGWTSRSNLDQQLKDQICLKQLPTQAQLPLHGQTGRSDPLTQQQAMPNENQKSPAVECRITIPSQGRPMPAPSVPARPNRNGWRKRLSSSSTLPIVSRSTKADPKKKKAKNTINTTKTPTKMESTPSTELALATDVTPQ